MGTRRKFSTTRGRRVAWVSLVLGLVLVADAIWCVTVEYFAAAVVVGGVGLERLVNAAAHYSTGAVWPWRLKAVRLVPGGIEFDEHHAYGGDDRTTTLPGGLVLDVEVVHGAERDVSSEWAVVVYTILGTIIWSEHEDHDEAALTAEELLEVLDRRDGGPLEAPEATGAIDLIASKRGVMWGRAPVAPISIVVRCVLLLATIVAVPALVMAPGLEVAVWGLVGITVALLSFPFLGAVAALMRPGRLMGFGLTVQSGELRSWEWSSPTRMLKVSDVRHIGFADVRPNGGPLALQLVAHAADGADVEGYVSTSVVEEMAHQAFKLLADNYDPDGPIVVRHGWSVRVPGGFAEAIEAVSWAQRFLAEGADQPLE